ncbi:MAG: hypothetical protein R3B07_08035 [Polyangiaceae bacterium]
MPSWLPEYSAAQREYLDAPAPVPVSAPARRVYPSLDRFVFANAPPFDPGRASQARAAVDQTIAGSPLLYVMSDLNDASLANWTAQYGPAAPQEPDPWVRAVSNSEADIGLVWATPPQAAQAEIDQANAALSRKDWPAAEAKLSAVLTRVNDVPALWILLAEVQRARGNDEGTLASARRALEIDPRSPDGHRTLAEVFARQGKLPEAKHELAMALALYPTSPRSWAIAKRYFRLRKRPDPIPSLIDVGRDGYVRIATPATPRARAYARCRAALRYEQDFRRRMLGLGNPYRLSMGEELMCYEAAVTAPAAGAESTAAQSAGAGPPAPPPGVPGPKQSGPPPAKAPPGAPPTQGRAGVPPPAPPGAPPPAPPGAPAGPPSAGAPMPEPPPAVPLDAGDPWMSLASSGHLPDFVLFDVIGQRRPEWLRVAPPKHHRALIDYVEHVVLD